MRTSVTRPAVSLLPCLTSPNNALLPHYKRTVTAVSENIDAQMVQLLGVPDAHRRAETLELLLDLERRGCLLPNARITEAVL